jgi:hypothetical protein
MSWTNECTESNVFKVKNTKEVKEVLELMGFIVYGDEDKGIDFITSGEGTFFDENTEVVLAKKPISIEGVEKNLIGIISDYTNDSIDTGDLEEEYGVTEEDVMIIPIIEYLQDQLLDDKQYITVTCAGFESRCSGSFSPFGDITVITKNSTKFMSLSCAIDNILKEENLAK